MRSTSSTLKWAIWLGALALAVSLAAGNSAHSSVGDFYAHESVAAKSVSAAIPVNPSAPFWKGPAPSTFRVYPQSTVRLNDTKANAVIDQAQPQQVSVRVAASSNELGVWMEWHDSTKTLANQVETALFGDSAAIQFPEKFGKGVRLPHIGMGDEGSQVRVHMQRAFEDGVVANEYVAQGFGSLTRVSKAVAKVKMEYDEKSALWRAVFVRPFTAGPQNLRSGLVPVAFAIWDGAGNQRGGNKFLSSWKFIKIDQAGLEPAYLKEASFGYNPGDLGSAEVGKTKVAQLCVSCHWVGESHAAPSGMAPNLFNVGGIATASYLRDSLLDPNAVIVRNLQLNRHYNKAADPDENRAYPNNEFYQWYIDIGGGKKFSKMPNLNLPAQDVADIVAYLKTQDGTQSPGR